MRSGRRYLGVIELHGNGDRMELGGWLTGMPWEKPRITVIGRLSGTRRLFPWGKAVCV
jgi:hypothetical protein